MRFLDELKEKRQDAIENVAGIDIDIEATKITLKSEQEQRAFWTKRIAEIDIAIAALKAADDHAYFAEKATAREQLEREPEIEAAPAEHISILTGDPAIEPESGLHGGNPVVIKPYRVTRDFDYEKTVEFFVTAEEATAYYNDLLGQPNHGVWLSVLRDGVWVSVAAMDEAPALNEAMQDEREKKPPAPGMVLFELDNGASVWAHPVEGLEVSLGRVTNPERFALNADMQDEREQPYRITANVDDKPVTIDFATFHDATECMEELKLRSTSKAELSVLHEGENGEQDRVTLSSFVEAEPQPDGYAPVTNPEAHIQAVEAERYALATNPEADALARAHDWYDPKAVADRNRFNPFSIFRREDA